VKVSDIGPTDAKIMLVGEAPGKTEEAKGVPFVGSSGKMLKQLLNHSGIDYSKCRVTNVVNERPPGNNFSFFYEDGRRNVPSPRLEKNWQELRAKIERVSPHVVVPLGAEPLRAITGKRRISEWRGTPMTYKDIKVIPTYHPRYIMSKYKHHPIAELDFTKVLNESVTSTPDEQAVIISIRPTIQNVIDWISDVMVTENPRVAFDIETVGRHVRCISLASMNNEVPSAISIPFFSFPSSALTRVSPGDKVITFDGLHSTYGSYWGVADEVTILLSIAELFDDNDVQIVGHNSISFDAPLIWDEFGICIKNHYMDTMHAWHVLYPELPKSLSFLCSVLTNYKNYWTEKIVEDDDSEWTYNAWDSIATLVVSYKVEEELRGVSV